MSDLTTVVISDIHSRLAKIRPLMERIGVLTLAEDPMDDVRNEGFWLIQLGDAVSLGYGMQEVAFYNWYIHILQPDEELVGNHEAPALWPHDSRFDFYGYAYGDLYTSGADRKCVDLVTARHDKYKLATSVGDWLITHAGLHIRFQKELSPDMNVEVAALALNLLWKEHVKSAKHASKGCVICDTADHNGGVLWLRWNGLKMNYDERWMKQIVGHTPIGGPCQDKSERLWLIDTPRITPGKMQREAAEAYGGVCCLVTKDDGETFEMIYEP